MACQAATVDDVFDKLRFVNEIGTQFPSQLGEEVRTHSVQDTGTVIHGMSRFEIVTGEVAMESNGYNPRQT